MVWYVETGMMPNRIIGFNPKTQIFSTPTTIPSGGGVVRSPPNLMPQNGLAQTHYCACVQEIGCSQLVHTD